MIRNQITRFLLAGSAALLLAACDNDNDAVAVAAPTQAPAPAAPAMVDFQIDITNLTVGQPLSPIALIAHGNIYSVFEVGSAATEGLERMAEGGDNSALIAEAQADSDVVTTLSGDSPVGPGASASFTLSFDESDLAGLQLSVMSMLVNTNDAITGVRGAAIGTMDAGESQTFSTISYDSGTEANSEASGTIPGPADGGEGFNAARDDIADEVRGHIGVITAADGLTTSALAENHRWDNPVTRVTIMRLP